MMPKSWLSDQQKEKKINDWIRGVLENDIGRD